MIIKDEHIRDTPFGPSFYKMLCERINTLVDEKSAISDMMQEQKRDEEGYWSSRLGKVEAQLKEFRREVERFGPPPAGSFVSFHYLFGDGYDAPSAAACKPRSRYSIGARLSVMKTRAKTFFRLGTSTKSKKSSNAT